MYRRNLDTTHHPENASSTLTADENQHSPYFQPQYNSIQEGLMEALPAFTYVLDLRTQKIVYASPNLEQLFGYNTEDIIDINAEDLVNLFMKEDAGRVIKADQGFIEILSTYPAAERMLLKSVITCRLSRYNGSTVPVQQQKIVLETGIDGSPLLMMAMITDITCGRKSFDFCSAIMLRDALKGWTELASAGIPCAEALSAREKEILKLLAMGKSSKIIAMDLSISVNTVNNHRKNMLLKTKANNIAGLVNYGLLQGII